MNKGKINYLDLTVNYSCPLACEQCASFSNYNFKKQYDSKQNEFFLRQLASKVDIYDIGLYGGEPLLHADYYGWIDLVKDVWPTHQNISMSIGQPPQSLSKNIEKLLYAIDKGIRLEFSVKNSANLNSTLDFVSNVLLKGKEFVINHDLPSEFEGGEWQWNEEDIHFFVNERRVVDVIPGWEHTQVAINQIINNQVILHKSDPKKAFKNCMLKICHGYREGRLYRCPITASLSEFKNQFKIHPDFIDTVENIQSISVLESAEDIKNFIDSWKHHEDACRLCPENIKMYDLNTDQKTILKNA